MKKNPTTPEKPTTEEPTTSTPAPEAPPAPPTSPSFNPLSDSVYEKSYTGAGANGSTPYVDIPEPNYSAPPPEISDIPSKQFTKTEQKAKEEKPKATANPDMQGMSDRDQREGAAAMTDVLLTTWKQAYSALNNQFKISEKSVNRMQAAGEIDMRLEVPYKMGTAPLTKVFQDYNNDAAEVLVLEKEFCEEVHPLITEELAKAGHGMSSRKQLMFLIGMKLAGDGYKAIQFLGLKKEYLKFARETMASGGARPVAATAAPVVPMTSSPSVATEMEADDFVQDEVITRTQPTTLQEQTLAHFIPNGVNTNPNFGNLGKLNKIAKEAKKAAAPKKKPVKLSAQDRITAAKTTVWDPPPTGKKKGRGRPAGAKNKPK